MEANLFRRWVLGSLLGVSTVVVIAASAGAAPPRAPGGTETYEKLVIAADGGNDDARASLAALNDFMVARGLRVDDLPPVESAETTDAINGASIRVVDSSPWFVTITNRTNIETAKGLEQYRLARLAALSSLAESKPNRLIEVMISPSTALAIADLAAMLRCPCSESRLVVDVYTDNGWLMTSGRTLGRGGWENKGEEATDGIASQAALSLDLYDGIGPEDLHFSVRYLRTRMSAQSALQLSGRPQIYAVDPIDDIRDKYSGRAALVEFWTDVDLRAAHAQLVLRAPVDSNPIWPVER